MTSKAQLRTAAKAARQAHVAVLSTAQRCAEAVMLAGHLEPHVGDARTVALYLPIGSEIDTLPIVERFAARDVTLALPHVTGRTGPLRFLRWAPGDPLPTGPMDLRQPEADAPEVRPDLILTPLLAFDARLHRLGYGAGHFDRAFAVLPNARRIGLAWAMQQVTSLPDDAWDVPLHGVATEAGYITP